jgi:hypothetical protein
MIADTGATMIVGPSDAIALINSRIGSIVSFTASGIALVNRFITCKIIFVSPLL